MKSSGIFKAGSIENFTDHFKEYICLWIHGLSAYREKCPKLINRFCMIKNFYSAHDTTSLCIDLICEFAVSIMRSIDIPQNRFKKSEIRNFLCRKILHIKHQIKIADTVSRYFMIKEQTSVNIQRFICKWSDLFADVFSFQHRNAFCSFRIFRSFLISFKLDSLLNHLCLFFIIK